MPAEPGAPGASDAAGRSERFTLLLTLVIFGIAAVTTLVPLWRAAGWPVNHDNAFGIRTYIYARHFSWLDFAPIWTSIDAAGFGSPMPLLYHKLFYALAGAIALGTSTMKGADVTTLALLLVLGATGVYRAVRELGASRLAATVGGCSLIAANYTVTNWLVRGAMAEFAAAMLVPWVLLFLCRTIAKGRAPVALGVALGLLWLSHSVVAFFVGLIVGATYLLLALVRMAPWSALDPRTAWPAVACLALLVGPYLAPMAVIGPAYEFDRILTPPLRPEYQFRPVADYVWEQAWRWGRTRSGLTVQFDHAMVALLVVGLSVLVVRGPITRGAGRWAVLRPALPFLIVVALASLLQLPIARPFYAWMPGAVFIQFPWRLLACITPALIIAAVFLADRTLPPEAGAFCLGAAGAWMLAACGAFAPLQDVRISVEPQPVETSFSGFREYEPALAPPLAELQTKLAARWAAAGCAYDRAVPSYEEVADVLFRTRCGRSTALPLPIFGSPLHSVRSSNYPDVRGCLPDREFPTLCGAIVPAAEGSVTVQLPTMQALGRWAWRRIWGGA